MQEVGFVEAGGSAWAEVRPLSFLWMTGFEDLDRLAASWLELVGLVGVVAAGRGTTVRLDAVVVGATGSLIVREVWPESE